MNLKINKPFADSCVKRFIDDKNEREISVKKK
jgi:hypothetical protein